MLLTTQPEKDVAVLLRKANALEADPGLRVDFDDAVRARQQALRDGYAMSMGTSMPGAAALAILLPMPRQHEPMTLSLGGPMAEIEQDRERLVALLQEAVEPFRQAALNAR
jgi:DNA-binding IclR family transcriptional regulator